MSVHDVGHASVSEIYPGTPHHFFGTRDLDKLRVTLPHPTDMRRVMSWNVDTFVTVGRTRFSLTWVVHYDFGPLRDGT